MALKTQLKSSALVDSPADVWIAFAHEGAMKSDPLLSALNKVLGGQLFGHLERMEFSGRRDELADVPMLGRGKAKRLVVAGMGPAASAHLWLRDAVASAVRAAANERTLALASPKHENDLRVIGEGLGLGAYAFSKYLTGERLPKRTLSQASVVGLSQVGAQAKASLQTGLEVAEAVCLARDAVNEPPNELYPEVLAGIARSIARKHGLKIKVLNKRAILQAGMKLHYAVGQGSAHEPRFIHMTYTPKRKSKRCLVFVGKGLTFDSGGLSIKPAAGMGEMKCDMGGAAAVLGLMAALPAVAPNIEVHGIVGAAENMPDGGAYRPGDVFGSLDGKTVEIINTDAEGRLVLADALAYASRLKPDVLIDAATLTGACVVALGKTCSGFYATTDKLASRLEAAAQAAGERFWRMPLLEELREQLKSDVADLKHTGERWGGSITAALFLREFTNQVPWIHCDIAGPVLSDQPRGAYPKGGTGHAVLTFLRFVEDSVRGK